jgi:hypothetical protein
MVRHYKFPKPEAQLCKKCGAVQVDPCANCLGFHNGQWSDSVKSECQNCHPHAKEFRITEVFLCEVCIDTILFLVANSPTDTKTEHILKTQCPAPCGVQVKLQWPLTKLMCNGGCGQLLCFDKHESTCSPKCNRSIEQIIAEGHAQLAQQNDELQKVLKSITEDMIPALESQREEVQQEKVRVKNEYAALKATLTAVMDVHSIKQAEKIKNREVALRAEAQVREAALKAEAQVREETLKAEAQAREETLKAEAQAIKAEAQAIKAEAQAREETLKAEAQEEIRMLRQQLNDVKLVKQEQVKEEPSEVMISVRVTWTKTNHILIEWWVNTNLTRKRWIGCGGFVKITGNNDKPFTQFECVTQIPNLKSTINRKMLVKITVLQLVLSRPELIDNKNELDDMISKCNQ